MGRVRVSSSTAWGPRVYASLPLTFAATLKGPALRFRLRHASGPGSLQGSQPLPRVPCSLGSETPSRSGTHFLQVTRTCALCTR